MAALLYFYPVPPPIKKTPANQGRLFADQPLVPKAPVKRRKPVVKKKKKGLSLQWKFVIAGLLLILFSPLYYGYVLSFSLRQRDGYWI